MTVYGIGVGGSSSLSSNSVTSNQEETAKPGHRYGVTHKSSEEDEVIISSDDNTDDSTALHGTSRKVYQSRYEQDMDADALLTKLDEMTEQFQTLSEQSADKIDRLEKKVTSLGARLGRMLSGLDRSAGAHLALRDISRFRQIASLGGGALDKLMTALGSVESKPLQDLQARVTSSDKQTAGGNTTTFSLMA